MENTRNQAHRRVRRTREESDMGIGRAFVISMISGGAGFVAAVLLILIFSSIALSASDPAPMISISGIAIPCVCYFLVGIISASAVRRAPLMCGAVSAATLTCLFAVITFILGAKSDVSAPIRAALFGAYLLLSVVGAIAAVNVRSSRSHRRSSRR